MPIKDFVAAETRFAVLARTHPERAAELAELIQADTDERWRYYEQLAGMHRSVPHAHPHEEQPGSEAALEAGGAGDGEGDVA